MTDPAIKEQNIVWEIRFLDMQAGGALAVYRHVREFTPNVRLVSLAGGALGWRAHYAIFCRNRTMRSFDRRVHDGGETAFHRTAR